MSLDHHLAQWIDPCSDLTVALTREQRVSLVRLGRTGLLPQCLPVAAPADGGSTQLDYCWYPGDRDTVRVTMAPDGDLVSLEYQHTACDGDGAPGEWKLDTGVLWGRLKSALLRD